MDSEPTNTCEHLEQTRDREDARKRQQRASDKERGLRHCIICRQLKPIEDFPRRGTGSIFFKECSECKPRPECASSKVCTSCKVEKPIGEFSKEKHAHRGVRAQCKACRAEYVNNKRDKEFPERVARREQRAYEIANQKRPCITCKVEKTFSEFSKSQGGKHGHAATCKSCLKAAIKRNPIPTILLKAKTRSNKRGWKWSPDLTPAYFKQPLLTCSVFKRKFEELDVGISPWLPSIDRIDNARPYECGNVAIISLRANVLKSDGTAEEHRMIAEWMLRHPATHPDQMNFDFG